MKKIFTLLIPAVGLAAVILFYGAKPKMSDQYIVVAWNDLGMHCANKDFQNMCILPPYNNLKAHVIKKGTESSLPEVMTANVAVTYEIPGNTYSVGKTNFWSYEDQIFGVNLPDNTGLTGVGLTGDMAVDGNSFKVDGIPVTPFQDNDLIQEDPFQLALVKVYDLQNNLLFETQPVIPVSNEISCVSSNCHSSETDILYAHEEEGGFDPTAIPVFCAECHQDNALGTPGHPGVPKFSQAIHQAHGEETNDCYKCHPGPNTQCHRDIMKTLGMVCQDCHGSVSNVGNTVEQGREPWLQEPKCGDAACHGDNYDEEPGKLFKQSRGHGGLYCSTCHSSPHAILPSIQARDNVQNINLQGFAGTLSKCIVCHGTTPAYPGPHGFFPTAIQEIRGIKDGFKLNQNFPNPFGEQTIINFSLNQAGKVYLDIIDLNGRQIRRLINEQLQEGSFQVAFAASDLPDGIYYCRLKSGRYCQTVKMLHLH